jgi:hypothetical protein
VKKPIFLQETFCNITLCHKRGYGNTRVFPYKKNSDITGISADFVRRIIEVVLAINVDRQ